MQLIEVSMTGVRSAVITLQTEQTPMRIVLLLMLYLGTVACHKEVAVRLVQCDLIVDHRIGPGAAQGPSRS